MEATLMTRVSVQGVKSLGGHFARLCRGFEFYEVKKTIGRLEKLGMMENLPYS